MHKLIEKYKYSETIPTIHVDTELIAEIEEYFLGHIPNKINLTQEEISAGLKIIFKEINGQQTFNSIKDFPFKIFPDNITRLVIGFSSFDLKKQDIIFKIHLHFSINQYCNSIETEIENINGRRTVVDIVDDLQTILKRKKTFNYLFYPTIVLYSILTGLTYMSFTMGIYFSFEKSMWSIRLFTLGFSILAYLFYFPKVKPFTSFETAKQIKIDKVADVFLIGLVGFLIFGEFLPRIINGLF